MNRKRIGILVVIITAGLIVVLNIKNILSWRKTNTLSELSDLARDYQQRGNLKEAKITYQRLINEFPKSDFISEWQKRIEDLNIKLLFSPLPTKDSITYRIKQGDTLSGIAKKFNTTVELLMKSNNLRTSRILPGRQIKVTRAVFSIIVDKSQNILLLKSDDEVLKTYTVSTGINNSTPTGTFKIVNKLINPTWFKAGAVIPPGSPKNVLGSRWLGFDLTGYGIHGTNNPTVLGKQITQGCIRMSNQDVEELYTIVPLNTEVIILD
jgi:lipoprotein-anchoring transpeptidase ErfK/SrfK